MRYLFVLLLLVGCGDNRSSEVKADVTAKHPKCEDIDGLMVANWKVVPDDYTGVAFECKNGKLYILANFKDGKEDGVARAWYDNGQLLSECNWKEGYYDGVFRMWYYNGQLDYEKNYKDGKIIDDKVIYYDEEGAIYRAEYYKDGELVRCEGDCD